MILFSILTFLKIFGKNSRTKFQYLRKLELTKEGHGHKSFKLRKVEF